MIEMAWQEKRMERISDSFDDYMKSIIKEEKGVQERISEIINGGCEKWLDFEDLDFNDQEEYVFQTDPFLLELGVWDEGQQMFFSQGRYVEPSEIYSVYK